MKIEKTSPMGLVEYEENPWSGKRAIKINGVLLTKKDRKTYVYNDGNERKNITVKGSYMYGLKIIIDGVEVELEEPPKWYEWVLFVVNIVAGMVLIGGAIGGALGALAGCSYIILSKPKTNPVVKIALGIGMLAALFAASFVLALILAPLFAA